MLHSGIDLPKRTVVLSTVDARGIRVADAELPTTRPAVRAYFAKYPGPHRAVVESTATWYWNDLISEGPANAYKTGAMPPSIVWELRQAPSGVTSVSVPIPPAGGS